MKKILVLLILIILLLAVYILFYTKGATSIKATGEWMTVENEYSGYELEIDSSWNWFLDFPQDRNPATSYRNVMYLNSNEMHDSDDFFTSEIKIYAFKSHKRSSEDKSANLLENNWVLEEATLGGLDATRATIAGEQDEFYGEGEFAFHQVFADDTNNTTYVLEYYDENNKEEYLDLFNHIVDTFELTDAREDTDHTLDEDLEYEEYSLSTSFIDSGLTVLTVAENPHGDYSIIVATETNENDDYCGSKTYSGNSCYFFIKPKHTYETFGDMELIAVWSGTLDGLDKNSFVFKDSNNIEFTSSFGDSVAQGTLHWKLDVERKTITELK
ncbi:MAG: hypothetical protein ABH833_02845 [Parcubacteria group bacterium]